MNFDRDRSGTVEPHELQQALVTFGYNLSPQAMGVLLRRYSVDGRVKFDSFVALCVRLKALTSELWRIVSSCLDHYIQRFLAILQQKMLEAIM